MVFGVPKAKTLIGMISGIRMWRSFHLKIWWKVKERILPLVAFHHRHNRYMDPMDIIPQGDLFHKPGDVGGQDSRALLSSPLPTFANKTASARSKAR